MMQQSSSDDSKKPKPVVVNAFITGRAPVPSAAPFQASIESIQNAASGASRWKEDKQLMNPPYYVYEKEAGSTIVEYGRAKEGQVFMPSEKALLWQEVKKFDDLDADILLAVFAQIIEVGNGTGDVWLDAKQFLDNRGLKQKKEGKWGKYRLEDILRVDSGLERISNLWVTISETSSPPTKKKDGTLRKVKKFYHSGRMLAIMETWTQETMSLDEEGIPRIKLPMAWRIKAGDWLLEYLNAPRFVAYLCKTSLQYDPYRELWEKRLSRYFMFHLRINAKHQSNVITRRIGLLINDLSLPVDERNPQKTRERFEKAMNRLVEDGQIDTWEYKEKEELPSKKWIEMWKNLSVLVTAKARVKEDHRIV